VSNVGEIPDEYLEDVQLLVSEVVSNAVRHGPAAPSSIVVRVAVTGQHLRVEVEDDGVGFATPPDRSVDPPGVGLHLVDRLTDRWGIDAGGTTVVWLEWDLATR
jgi:anti-sigma regulatory factor (Ser/Thr protein kinase)